MNIIQAIHSPKVFRPLFAQLETWQSWSVFLSAAFGLPITEGPDLELFKKCTGLEQPPTGGAQEIFCISGRRSGKSRIAALVGVYLACFCDWRKVLARGERGKVMLIAVDRTQARTLRDYCGGILDANPMLRSLVKQEGKESIELDGVDIEIMTANYRSIRGRTVICGVLDEAAFFRADEASANPAREIYNALRPSMATVPGSKLIAISTTYAKEGLMYEARQRYFGQPGKTLAWVADSMTMNPTLDKAMIEEELSKDRAAASAEWLSIERSDLSTYVDGDLVGDLVVPDRFELPRIENVSYVAFVDPAGGAGRDSMTMAVCHLEEPSGRIIQDAIRVQRPPFNPKACVQEFVGVLKAYGVASVTGDKYSGDWCASTFREEGIDYRNSEKTKSDVYLEFLPLLTQRRVELLDHPRTVTEIRQLERKAGSGRDSVDHPKNLHDDCANVVAGACVLVGRGGCAIGYDSGHYGDDGEDHDVPGVRADSLLTLLVRHDRGLR